MFLIGGDGLGLIVWDGAYGAPFRWGSGPCCEFVGLESSPLCILHQSSYLASRMRIETGFRRVHPASFYREFTLARAPLALVERRTLIVLLA